MMLLSRRQQHPQEGAAPVHALILKRLVFQGKEEAVGSSYIAHHQIYTRHWTNLKNTEQKSPSRY